MLKLPQLSSTCETSETTRRKVLVLVLLLLLRLGRHRPFLRSVEINAAAETGSRQNRKRTETLGDHLPRPRAKAAAQVAPVPAAPVVPLPVVYAFKKGDLVALPATKSSGDICWVATLLVDMSVVDAEVPGANVKVQYAELDHDVNPDKTVFVLQGGWVKVCVSKIICTLPGLAQ